MKYDPEKAECTVTLTQSGFENQKEESDRYPWIVRNKLF
jgi:hypothetical protein